MTLYRKRRESRVVRKKDAVLAAPALEEDQFPRRFRSLPLQLHGAAVEHVEHVGVGGAATISVVANEIVDAHAGPVGRLGVGGRRGAVASRR